MTDNHNIYVVLFFAFALGAALGSFVTLASYRLPRGEEIVFRPSYCPACMTPLRALELFPILSWILQKGRCLNCKNPIHIRYPLIECALALTFTGIAWRYGVSLNAVCMALLATTLAIMIVTDFEHTIIPDGVQIALFGIAIIWHGMHHDAFLPFIAGAAGGLTLGLLLHYGYLIFRKKDALGWGDVKFFAGAGFWLAPDSYVMFLLIAGLMGTFTGLLWRAWGRGAIFPFGPALALSLFINVLFPDMLQRGVL